jgi:CRP-like cAMP-binding protein
VSLFTILIFTHKLIYTLAAGGPGLLAQTSLGPDFNPLSAVGEHQEDMEEDEDEDEEEERDTVPDHMPTLSVPPPSSRGRRTSVSAESMQPSLQNDNYVKLVIPKSDDQRASIRSAIGNNFLFKNLDEEQYTDVINAMVEKPVKSQETVIEQGGVGDYFYIVESGQLDCFISGKKVTSYVPGGSFGELALMYNAPRAASIVATTDCILYALDRVTFRSILMENTARKRRMYERFLEEVPIFKSLEVYERHKIADALDTVQFNENEVVIHEGDVGDNFYLIESGEAIFYKSLPDGTQKEVMVGKKGDYFGGKSCFISMLISIYY